MYTVQVAPPTLRSLGLASARARPSPRPRARSSLESESRRISHYFSRPRRVSVAVGLTYPKICPCSTLPVIVLC